jgi:hypothetical protein
MTFDLVTLACIVFVWILLYYTMLRRILLDYAVTAGVTKRIEAAEGSLVKTIGLWLEGKKAAAVLFVTSLLGAARALGPADLEPLKDASLWHAFLADDVVAKIMSALAILAAVLTIRGHLTAARIVPATAPAAAAPTHG